MRRLCAFLLLALVATPPASAQAQDAASGEAERRAARLEAHKGDFDYLLGSWRFTASSKDFGEFGGYWTAVRLATGGGAHVLDEYRVVGDDGETYFASTTLRAYNAVQDVWELVSTDRGTGLQDFGTGRQVGDEMHIEQRFGVAAGKPELWRIRYYDIRPDGFSWAADRSLDGGATWERGHMTLRATRIGPARSLEPLAAPRAAGREPQR